MKRQFLKSLEGFCQIFLKISAHPGPHKFYNFFLSQLGSDSKAVGEHLGHQHSQSGAAEDQLCVPTGHGGVSPGADGSWHAEADPGHNISLSAERPGDQVCQEPDGGSTGQGRLDECMVYIWQRERRGVRQREADVMMWFYLSSQHWVFIKIGILVGQWWCFH